VPLLSGSSSAANNCFLVKLKVLCLLNMSESTHIIVGFNIQHRCCGNLKFHRVEVISMHVKLGKELLL